MQQASELLIMCNVKYALINTFYMCIAEYIIYIEQCRYIFVNMVVCLYVCD